VADFLEADDVWVVLFDGVGDELAAGWPWVVVVPDVEGADSEGVGHLGSLFKNVLEGYFVLEVEITFVARFAYGVLLSLNTQRK
jgi:hypothetical protein